MTFGSLFAGIGGFDLGLERAGMQCKWQCEIDKYANQILQIHWPEVKRYEDIKKLTKPESVDLICGGFPCQDVSMAGNRAGLAGERSGLFFELARIINEVKPKWFILENVPGLLSSNQGWDMATVIETLAKIGYCISWRVLDSQFFGVAQRRKRVFIVGSLGNAKAASIVFEKSRSKKNSENVEKCYQKCIGTNIKYKENKIIKIARIYDKSTTLLTNIGTFGNPSCFPIDRYGIRKFSPIECERLQGFPDGWTAGLSDTQRYKTLGNAVTVQIIEWIGKRIMEEKCFQD